MLPTRSLCSVTAFNGSRYRQRPIEDVIREFRSVPEKRVLIVDDNLIGAGPPQMRRAKELFRAMVEADLGKQWIGQATVNFADDEDLLELAVKAGCIGVFIGFESPTPEGLAEEMTACNRSFYSIPRILWRMGRHVSRGRSPLFSVVGNFSCRRSSRLLGRLYADFRRQEGSRFG